MDHKLVFKWGVSRGRDTYGYTICSLYVDGNKVAMCNGGGYDMMGTVLGYWVASKFHDELLKLNTPFYGLSYHDPNFNPGKVEIDGETVEQREKNGKSMGLERYQQFYKASSDVPTERHIIPLIDGACGFSSVTHILNKIGYKIPKIHSSNKEDIYIVSKKEVKS